MTNRESPTSKARELGLVIQGTTINRDFQPRATLQTPFTRYDTNHINFATGNFGSVSNAQQIPNSGRPASSSIQPQTAGGRRTTGR